MKSITFLPLLILFSLSLEKETPLTFLVVKFLPKINGLVTTPLTFTKSIKKFNVTASIAFREITQNNVFAVLENSDLVHLKIYNFTADLEARIKYKLLGFPIILTGKGLVDTNVDMKFKVETKKVDGKSVLTATITDLKTNTNLTLIAGEKNIDLTKVISEELKKEIEEKILDVYLKKQLQKLLDKTITKLF